MTIGRRREAWDHTAAVVAMLAAAGGVELDPGKLNPYRWDRPAPPPSPEDEERRQRELWKLFETGLRYAARR